MLFNSYVFVLGFLPLTLGIFALLAGRYAHASAWFLVIASLAFYTWSSPWYHVGLLLASIVFNFAVGLGLRHKALNGARRVLLAFGVVVDLMVLGYFKYSDFFVAQVGFLTQIGLGRSGVGTLLPLGVSFYTFTQIAYLADVYANKAQEYAPANYALFVTWFPHLIAGPIMHHREMMPQFATAFRAKIDPRLVLIGLSIFSVGLAKKVLLADQAAPFADAVFDRGTLLPLTFAEAWVGALAYAMQIYFDFSGYSDMAIGLSLMFGVRLPVNFNSPYKSKSIIEFWRRWHMTLSRFLRDYVYIPLGGNRRGPVRRYANLMATMLIGGLWHGAGWTFVIWGALHGLYLMANHAWNAAGGRLPKPVAMVVTFLAVVVAWVFFRASDFTAAFAVLRPMALGNGLALPSSLAGLLGPFESQGLHFDGLFANGIFSARLAFLTLGILLAAVWLLPNTQEVFRSVRPAILPDNEPPSSLSPLQWRATWEWGCALGLLFGASFVRLGGDSPFLYFRF
jgi:alginate O-acetyltransferase complex protein AlgI